MLINAEVQTPNGPGVIQGYSDDPPGYIVRHQLKKMTSREKGTCITPVVQFANADSRHVSGLWVYPAQDITPN